MQLTTLKDLFITDLKDTYDAEQQILEALPKMAAAASHPELQAAFQEHEIQTREHVSRLEQVFQRMGCSPERKTCKGMKGLLAEGQELMKEKADPDVLDAGMICAAQKVEHYEIAAYGTLRTYAAQMGDHESCRLLQTTLDEEGETDHRLTSLAESRINLDAETPMRMAA